ncbi:MAG: hypothetical protein ACK5C5_09470 [Bacteroidota bacterium]|jgi:hypothetical protein
MGITKHDTVFLFHAKKSGVDFTNTAMLGRQVLYAAHSDIDACISKFGFDMKKSNQLHFKDDYSEPLFETLGANSIDSIDYSDYEGATIIADLNKPNPSGLNQRFTCILDGGTIEHIFNFPVAIKTCMDAIKVGGFFLGVTPANNQMGHGFYQFSPELIYRVFSEENGFRVRQLLLSADAENSKDQEWFEVPDPKNVKSRVMLVNNKPITMRYIAEKIAQKDVFAITPQQSDYTATWERHEALENNDAAAAGGILRMMIRKYVPYGIKVFGTRVINFFTKPRAKSSSIGIIDPEHFRRVDI